MDRNIIETHVILLSRTRRRNTVTGTSKETEIIHNTIKRIEKQLYRTSCRNVLAKSLATQGGVFYMHYEQICFCS